MLLCLNIWLFNPFVVIFGSLKKDYKLVIGCILQSLHVITGVGKSEELQCDQN